MYKKEENKKGFTLIEVLVSMFVFAIVMLATISIFAQIMSNYRYTRETQRALEDAQFAMNRIAKVLRTSTVVSSSTSQIIAYDYSQGKCVRYALNSVAREITETVTSGNSPNDCGSGGVSNVLNVAPLTGSFLAQSSDNASKTVGYVVMSFEVEGPDSKKIYIQTTVSLRDYEVSGLL